MGIVIDLNSARAEHRNKDASPELAAPQLDAVELGLGLRLAVLGEIDNSPLPEKLRTALHHAAQQGDPAAHTLLAWRDARLLDVIQEMEA